MLAAEVPWLDGANRLSLRGRHPSMKYSKSALLIDSIGLRQNFRRDPLREWHDVTGMATRWCVLLSNLRKLLRREAFGKANKVRPKAPMNQRDLSADEPAHENLVRVGHGSKDRVDVMALWMRPPAALDVFPDNRFRKARRRPLGRREDDAVLSDESQRLLGSRASRHDARCSKLIGVAAKARWREHVIEPSGVFLDRAAGLSQDQCEEQDAARPAHILGSRLT